MSRSIHHTNLALSRMSTSLCESTSASPRISSWDCSSRSASSWSRAVALHHGALLARREPLRKIFFRLLESGEDVERNGTRAEVVSGGVLAFGNAEGRGREDGHAIVGEIEIEAHALVASGARRHRG